MIRSLVISIDAMGGDHGPSVIVPAVALVARSPQGEGVRFLLHGDEAKLKAELARHPSLSGLCDIRHTDKVVAMDEKPGAALRRGKGTSLWNAVEAVRDGAAQAAVSAGNTGALMAIARLIVRMVGDMERPSLVASWPTMNGVCAVLDVGANIESDADQLIEFAIMGAAFHRAAHGSSRTTVGLLNVGSEDQKGHEEVREAHARLRASNLDFDYKGFVEGDDIAKGTVDVIVTDGFTGNVALKTAEGLARFFSREVKTTFKSGPMALLGAIFASGALKAMRARLDPGAFNGAPLLGLKEIVVKSHGGADAAGFANAIKVTINLARSDFIAEVERNLKGLNKAAAAAEPLAVSGDVK